MGTNKIPLRIHQIWMNPKEDGSPHEIPEKYQANVAQWRKLCGHNNYYLWNETTMSKFIEKWDPEFLELYKHLPSWINRCDAFRYFVLYQMGGIYVDMDARLSVIGNNESELKTMIQNGNTDHFFVVKTKILGKNWYTNCCFGSSPKNTIMKKLYKNVKASKWNVMTCAGPWYLTETLWDEKNEIFKLSLADIGVIHQSDRTWVSAQMQNIIASRWFSRFLLLVALSFVIVITLLVFMCL